MHEDILALREQSKFSNKKLVSKKLSAHGGIREDLIKLRDRIRGFSKEINRTNETEDRQKTTTLIINFCEWLSSSGVVVGMRPTDLESNWFGEIKECLLEVKKIADQIPEVSTGTGSLLMCLGVLESIERNHASAIRYYKEIKAGHPSYAMARECMVRELFMSDRYKESVDLAAKLCSNFSNKYSIGTVALSYPSIGDRQAKIRDAVGFLTSTGFKVQIGDLTYKSLGYKTGSIEERVRDFTSILLDEEVNLILNTTGGFNSNEILEFIPWAKIIDLSNKTLIGYSDITAINLALLSKTKIKSVDGMMLVDFYDDPAAFLHLFHVLENHPRELFNYPFTWEDSNNDSFYYQGPILTLDGKGSHASGRVLAGNQSTLNLMLGTPFMPKFEGSILFIEYDKEEQTSLPSVERMLWQIRHAGIFDKIKGLVFGTLQPSVIDEETINWGLIDILESVTSGYNFPVLYNAQFGHMYPSWSLENNSHVEITGNRVALK
ncbi:MAG: LD-carboxypeptidase [Bdellovibrionota bacterium]